ncbi:hypothetical protein CKO18_18380 [Rhodoferax fermentans]|uniref:Uncharacterized protein n=2 Tax=Rhodoferax fermentans TaxID=28066 RepID=A0A1T1AND0_RHOFE|nr:hypothetical protein [Rhodoferax fermentans]OOV05646.1 hypothetical protein RF819_02010 [Rhodoferax fermentans]
MLIPGQSGASVLMPIDTATLLNSQVKSVEATGASKEFLRKGFENAEPNICAVLTGALKV